MGTTETTSRIKCLCSGTETIAGLNPTKIVTSTSAMKRFEPTRRGCYTDKEFELTNLKWSSGFRYSISNCLYDAVVERSVKVIDFSP